MKKIVCVVAILLSSILPSNVQANSQQIKCKSDLYVLKEGKNEKVNKGYDFKKSKEVEYLLKFELINDAQKDTVRIDISDFEGLEIDNQSIKVNDQTIQKDELNKIDLDNKLNLELKVKYMEDSVKVATKINITSLTDKKSHSFAFYYTVNETEQKQETHIVKFYGIANELIDVQNVPHNQSANIPTIHTLGYEVSGFNSLKNGKGSFYAGERIKSNQNYYLIYKSKRFNANYFVDDILFKKMKMDYGSTVVDIAAPEKKGHTFVMWLGLVDNIQNDVNLHAVYQRNEDGTYISSETIDKTYLETIVKKIVNNMGEYLTNQYCNVKNNSECYAYVDKDGKLQFIPNDKTGNGNICWLFLIVLGLLGIIYFYIKRKRQGEENEEI